MEPRSGTHNFGKEHCEICPMQDPLKYRTEIGAYCKQYREYLYKDGLKILRGPSCLREEVTILDILYPQLKGKYYEPSPENTSC